MDNSIGEEGTTNNKFDEVSITNDKIVKERASRVSKSVDEDAMHRDSVSPDCQSRFRVSGVQEFEFHRVKRWRPEQDQIFEVSSGDTRSDLRCR